MIKESCNMELAVSKLFTGMHIEQVIIVKEARSMRSRDLHRENVVNILAICLPIMTMEHIRKSPSASHATSIYLDIHDFHCGPPEQLLFPAVTVHFLKMSHRGFFHIQFDAMVQFMKGLLPPLYGQIEGLRSLQR